MKNFMRKTAELFFIAALAAFIGMGAPKVAAQFVGYFTANLPIIGAADGSGNLAQGQRTGNTTNFVTRSATATATDNCAKWDAAGNLTTTGVNCATLIANPASLSIADQVLTGGANVTSKALTAGSLTVDCGAVPLQYINNSGAFTVTAPANDGSCIVLVTNITGAGAITFVGFSVAATAALSLDTVSGHKFSLQIWRVNGVSGYSVVPHQ